MTEFERFACYVRNIGTATLSRYGAVLSNHINPAVIEERKLNATSIDVNIWLSRRKLCVKEFEGLISSGEITTLCSENIMFPKHNNI